jgi:hypothetical protein
MNNSGTVSLSTSLFYNISGYSPFILTIDPLNIITTDSPYKISYDFGDGIYFDQSLPLVFINSNSQTHLYSLSTVGNKNYNVKVNIYTFGSSPVEYNINLLLLNSPIETTYTGSSSISGYFNEVHLVGSRMFGPNNDILYMFESITPNYILPVMVNWKKKPISPPITISIPNNRPFTLLAPFEQET